MVRVLWVMSCTPTTYQTSTGRTGDRGRRSFYGQHDDRECRERESYQGHVIEVHMLVNTSQVLATTRSAGCGCKPLLVDENRRHVWFSTYAHLQSGK